jgi:hypothetical protein
MKKIDLGQTITILANVGVIAGIFFLVLEARQLQDQLDAQIGFDVFSQRNQGLQILATDPLLAGIIDKRSSGEALSSEENFRIDAYLRSLVFREEYSWIQFQRGRFQESDIEGFAGRVRNDFWGISSTWDSLRSGPLDADFVAAVERELDR